MQAIDIHAHLTPQCFQREVLAGKTWYGMTNAEGELFNPRNAWTPDQRLADMRSLGVDVQVVSTALSAPEGEDQEGGLVGACPHLTQEQRVLLPPATRRWP